MNVNLNIRSNMTSDKGCAQTPLALIRGLSHLLLTNQPFLSKFSHWVQTPLYYARSVVTLPAGSLVCHNHHLLVALRLLRLFSPCCFLATIHVHTVVGGSF